MPGRNEIGYNNTTHLGFTVHDIIVECRMLGYHSQRECCSEEIKHNLIEGPKNIIVDIRITLNMSISYSMVMVFAQINNSVI